MKPIFHSAKRVFLSLAVFLAPAAVWAHPGHAPAVGFATGFFHPISGLDHMVAMVAVGLWAAQIGGRAMFLLPLSFVAALGLGAALGFAGASFVLVEPMILASVFIMGLFLCLGFKPRWWLGMLLVSLFGLFHGQAHSVEIPMAASGIVYGLGFVTASLALHGLGLGAAALLGNARFHSPKILLRLSGFPVLAGGVLLIAV